MTTPTNLIEQLGEQLAALEQQDLMRNRRVVESPQGPRVTVGGRALLNFSSNDYLGLAAHPDIVQAACEGARNFGVGSGASALISGHGSAHEALEARLARFVEQDRALLFSTGYMANLAVVSALVGRGDAVFSDQINHASLVDGCRLSRAALHIYNHLDMQALDALLSQVQSGHKLVVSDAVFSMDGDIAPLRELIALCERHNAWLLLDDAHGFGVLGRDGRGTPSHFGVRSANLIHMCTLGKAAGVAGAFVAGHALLIEWLLQRARTYVFTTAAPALLAHAMLTSIELIEREGWRREQLRRLIEALQRGVEPLGFRLLRSETAVQAIIVGRNDEALRLSRGLLARDIWVPAIRPPTVPAGTARLRISLSAAHTMDDLRQLVDALSALKSESA